MGHGSGNTLGQVDGEERHTLTAWEIPSAIVTPYATASGGSYSCFTANAIDLTSSASQDAWTNVNSVGGGSHNNMPPYYVVNIWKRVA